jgi:hypothetical protein
MYVVGFASNFNYVLSRTDDSYTDSDWDIAIEDPDGVYNYVNDVTGYVNPTSEATGSLSYSFTPTVPGVHTIILSRGTAANHTIKHKQLFSVVSTTENTELFVTL